MQVRSLYKATQEVRGGDGCECETIRWGSTAPVAMIRRARLRSASVGIYKPAFPASGHSLDQSHFLVSPPCRTRTTTDTSSNIPSRDSITLPQVRLFLFIYQLRLSFRGLKFLRASAWPWGWLLSPATSASLPAGLWWTAWLSATTPTSGGLCVRFCLPCRKVSIAHPKRSLLFSQQAPPQKNNDFCAACLAGVCLCCCAEGAWSRRYVLTFPGAYRVYRTFRQSFARASSK
jgi:hypothetical protein